MKELSIEDKAKRYDEAIEFAHNKHRFSSNLSEIKLIEELFPELQESEDDRIINNIKKAAESYWSDEPLHEILAWLEKHCEQKHAIKLERDDNGEAVLTPFEAELFSMMSEAWQGYSFGEEVNIAKIVKEHSKELLERANEQKTAWNEEDEKLFRCAIDAVKQESKVRTDGCLDEEVGEMVTNWLKSLKERVQPQNTWRPSDEQMKLLREVQQALLGKDCHNRFVNLMYELKRLMGE